MRYFYFIIIILFLFSCAGMYKPEDQSPVLEEKEEMVRREEKRELGEEELAEAGITENNTIEDDAIYKTDDEEYYAGEEAEERDEIKEIAEETEENPYDELADAGNILTEDEEDKRNLEEEMDELRGLVLDLLAALESLINLPDERPQDQMPLQTETPEPQAQPQIPAPSPPVTQPPQNVQLSSVPQVTETTPPQESAELAASDSEDEEQLPQMETSETFRPPVHAREEPLIVTPSTSIIVPREPEPGSPIIFSRVVRATVGQIIEIPFRGTGWVYLGELAARRGIAYDSRRNDTEGLSFIFRAEDAGTFVLKFSRHDFIRDYILNDHVQVIVGESPVAGTGWFNPPLDRGRVIAQPRWPSAFEEAEILRGGVPRADTEVMSNGQLTMNNEQLTSDSTAASVASVESFQRADVTQREPASTREPSNISEVIQGTGNREQVTGNREQGTMSNEQEIMSPPHLTEIIPLDQLVTRAKELFDNGNTAGAIALLDQYKEHYPSGTDELYWLYGQFYEANTPSRNILLSLDYYKRLTNEFPQSNRFNDARRRIAYLERFYINIQ